MLSKTVNDVYIELFKRFRDASDPQPSLSARELVAYVCRADKRKTASWAHRYVDDATSALAHSLCTRCLHGEPLAYILGEWDFYGYTFKVTPSVLIPRGDTECLCELAIKQANQVVNPRVLDVCCGTGCIGIALLKEVSDAKVTAVDLSDEAIAVSEYNAGALDVTSRYHVLKADALKTPPELGQFEILVSNPPYISREEMRTLDTSVRDFEPPEALCGGEDGLDFYHCLANRWGDLLVPSGLLLLECGHQQAQSVAQILDDAGYAGIGITEDYAGIPRIVFGYSIGRGEIL